MSHMRACSEWLVVNNCCVLEQSEFSSWWHDSTAIGTMQLAYGHECYSDSLVCRSSHMLVAGREDRSILCLVRA